MTTSALQQFPSKAGVFARAATVFFLLTTGFSVALPVILAWLHFRILAQARRALVWLVVLHPIVRWLDVIRILMIAAAFICLIAWVYSIYRDFVRRGADTRYGPVRAVVGFVVPGLNLVWPHLMVNNAWRVASELGSGKESDAFVRRTTPLAIKLWWPLYLIVMFIRASNIRAVRAGQMELSAALVGWNLCLAASCLLAIAVIAGIERERRSLPASQPVSLLGHWPLPVSSSVAAVLATLLVLLGAYGFSGLEMRQVRAAGTVSLSVIPPEMFPLEAWSFWSPGDWHVKAEFEEGSVRVSWRRSGFPNVVGYNVYRRSEGSAAGKINREVVAQPTFSDNDIHHDSTYHYSVSAVDSRGNESAHSGEASLTVPSSPVREQGLLREPVQIPTDERVPEGVAAGGVEGGAVGGVLGEIKSRAEGSGDARKAGTPVRVSGEIKMPKLIRSVEPVYPELAKQNRVAGVVILDVTTDVYGRVTSVQVLRSIPLLDQAAIDAVRQWVYKPVKINGEPRAVIFTVKVLFELKPL